MKNPEAHNHPAGQSMLGELTIVQEGRCTMYLNGKAWEVSQEDSHVIAHAMKNFLDIYADIKRKHPRKEIYVPEIEYIYSRSINYP